MVHDVRRKNSIAPCCFLVVLGFANEHACSFDLSPGVANIMRVMKGILTGFILCPVIGLCIILMTLIPFTAVSLLFLFERAERGFYYLVSKC